MKMKRIRTKFKFLGITDSVRMMDVIDDFDEDELKSYETSKPYEIPLECQREGYYLVPVSNRTYYKEYIFWKDKWYCMGDIDYEFMLSKCNIFPSASFSKTDYDNLIKYENYLKPMVKSMVRAYGIYYDTNKLKRNIKLDLL